MKIKTEGNMKNIIYRINPYNNRREIVAVDGIATKDHWVMDWKGDRYFVEKGTKVNEEGLPE